MMPLLGWLLGIQFQAFISTVDHWIAFLLLSIIGINMVRESREESEDVDCSFSFRSMLPLAVGVTFAFLQVDILPAITFIGLTTFLLSAAGVQVGALFGTRFRGKAELAGGLILMLMGIKILLEHLGILG